MITTRIHPALGKFLDLMMAMKATLCLRNSLVNTYFLSTILYMLPSSQLSTPEVSSADSFISQPNKLRHQLPRSSKCACQPRGGLFRGHTHITTLRL